MYGLPPDVDLGFLIGARLLQICVGENEVILNLFSDISVMVASSVRVTHQSESPREFEDARSMVVALLPLLGCTVSDVSGRRDGTLDVTWDNGTRTEILDTWDQFESYTVRNGDHVIVV